MGQGANSATRTLRFGVFEVDLRSGELRKSGVRIRVQEQPFKVLEALLERPGEIVTREELRARIWPHESFGDFDHAVNIAVAKLRTALGDSAETPRFIETLHRRGYRFIAPVAGHVASRPQQAATEIVKPERRSRWAFALLAAPAVMLLILALIWKWPSLFPRKTVAPGTGRALAVVEIENMSGDRSLDWLGNGVAELLTNDLAQANTLEVISTERVRGLIRRRVKGEGQLPPDQAQEVAQEAHADMFLSGALLKVGTGLRLDLRVQQTGTGRVVFADKVEGENAQAVFAMVDKATAGILSQLAPGEFSQPNVGASLTANLDALHAYEEGLGYYDRALFPDAEAAFRRAIQLDPQFAMAYYRLAWVYYHDNFAAARREIASAANLAKRLPLPREQKLLIQAAQFRYEGRSQEAEQVLRTAVREFPREIEPRYLLFGVFHDEGKVAELKPVMEEILRIDERYGEAYNELAYSDAVRGDLTDALAALDQYAAILPPNDPNPIDTRGDVLAISGRYEEAIAQYKKNAELNPSFGSQIKIALAYLYEANDSLAEASAQTWYEKSSGVGRAIAAGVLGDVEVGRGRLDRAVAYYEEAAGIFANHDSALAEAPLLKAVHIYFEQGRADAVLALGRRDTTRWAPGVRAMAYLFLNNESSAEKEFASLRASLTRLVGDYMAEQTVQLDRLLVAGYAGHWQQVSAHWSQVAGLHRGKLIELPVGRAYLEAGALTEAEGRLRSLLQRERNWGDMTEISFHDFLSYKLAQFYLGKILEQTGKKAEAIQTYRDFLRHFENSTVPLPQIAEARAALKSLP